MKYIPTKIMVFSVQDHSMNDLWNCSVIFMKSSRPTNWSISILKDLYKNKQLPSGPSCAILNIPKTNKAKTANQKEALWD